MGMFVEVPVDRLSILSLEVSMEVPEEEPLSVEVSVEVSWVSQCRRTTNGRGPGGGPNCPGEQTHNRSILQVRKRLK